MTLELVSWDDFRCALHRFSEPDPSGGVRFLWEFAEVSPAGVETSRSTAGPGRERDHRFWGVQTATSFPVPFFIGRFPLWSDPPGISVA